MVPLDNSGSFLDAKNLIVASTLEKFGFLASRHKEQQPLPFSSVNV